MKVRKCPARERSLIIDISPFYENEKPRRAASKGRRAPPYEELVIPQNVERWTVDLSKLTGFLMRDQDMANIFLMNSTHRPRRNLHIPFRDSQDKRKTWPAPLLSHELDGKFRMDSVSHKGRGPSQQVSLQAWVLYGLRSILTSDLRNAWKEFGGLAAQLPFLSVAPHLGVAENAAFAISYDHEVRARAQRLSRNRDITVDYAKFLSAENEEAKRYLISDLARGRPSTGANPYVPGRKKSPDGKPNNAAANTQTRPLLRARNKTTRPRAQGKIIHAPNPSLMHLRTQSGPLRGKTGKSQPQR